jgi:hypothetical protein
LSRFRGEELEALDGALARADEIVARWVAGDTDEALMAMVNRTVRPA